MEKDIILFLVTLFFSMLCQAQRSRNIGKQPGRKDTIWIDLTNRLKFSAPDQGSVKIHTQPNRFDLYASYKNKKLTDYVAISINGIQIPSWYFVKNSTSYCCVYGGPGHPYTCYKVMPINK